MTFPYRPIFLFLQPKWLMTLFLNPKYWGDQCMARPPTLNFGGDRPPSPPRSPPLIVLCLIVRPTISTLGVHFPHFHKMYTFSPLVIGGDLRELGDVLRPISAHSFLFHFGSNKILFLHGFTLRLSSLFIKRFWAWLLAIFAK